jgi:hypothetical protein
MLVFCLQCIHPVGQAKARTLLVLAVLPDFDDVPFAKAVDVKVPCVQ